MATLRKKGICLYMSGCFYALDIDALEKKKFSLVVLDMETETSPAY